ncbi:MAG: amino acid adenylation domain-containing protein [Clostridiales bacterium]|jgi:amino acid adenylation domain-containing protein/thioester reductase-like protein|nr:amino acid adenylation domain-containing protein [Clostridiales bacterium]
MKARLVGESLETPENIRSLADLFERSAKSGYIIYVDNNGEETVQHYERLKKEALRALRHLNDAGVNAGDTLVFQLLNQRFFITTFWACVFGGIIAVPITAPTTAKLADTLKKLDAVIKKLGETNVIFESRVYDDIRDVVSSCRAQIEYENIDLNDERVGKTRESSTDDIAYIQFSSGSTSHPKGAPLTHGNLICNTLQLKNRIKPLADDFIGSWLPLTHDMGLVGFHIVALCFKNNHLLMQPFAFMKNPAMFYQKVKKYKITIISLPNFAVDWSNVMVRDKRVKDLDLSSVRLIFNGSEPINYNSIVEFNKKFAPAGLSPKAMYPVYGMAEACIGVSLPQTGFKLTVSEKPGDLMADNLFVSVGKPLDGMEIIITDKNNRTLEEGENGRVLIKGGNVITGYYMDDEVNAENFWNGYLKTGDMGFVKDGQLYISGREKDVFFINGQNCYLNDVDIALKERGADNAAAVYCEKESALIIFVKSADARDAFKKRVSEINGILRNVYGVAAKYVLPIKNLPKTTSGKIQRFELLDQYGKNMFEDALKDIYLTNDAEGINPELMKIWSRILKISPSAASMGDFFSQGGDSIKLTGLLAETEDALDLKPNLREFMDNPTLTYLNSLIGRNERDGEKLEPNESLTDVSKPFPSTDLQKAYFIGAQTEMSTKVLYEWETSLDMSRLERAVNKVIASQAALRTFFLNEGEQRLVPEDARYVIEVTDISELNDREQRERLDLRFEELKRSDFNVREWPLFSITAFKLSEHVHRAFFHFDMILADGLSLKILINEILSFYFDENKPPAFNDSFIKYCRLRQARKDTDAYRQSKAFWLDKIKDFPSAPVLPRLEGAASGRFNRISAALDAKTWLEIKTRLLSLSLTPSAFLLGVYAKTLSLYSGEKRFAVNMPVMNRDARDDGEISAVGDFTSILLLDIDLNKPNFLTLCEDISLNVMESLRHIRFDGVEYMREIAKEREAAFPVVFTAMLNDDFGVDVSALGTVKMGYSQTSRVYLDCQVYEENGALIMQWDFREMDGELISRMFSAFKSDIYDDEKYPELTFPAIDRANDARFIKAAARRDYDAISSYNETDEDLPAANLNIALKRSFERYRDNVALICGGDTMTYGELEKRVNGICGRLIELGVKRGDRIGVFGGRSFKTICNVLGALKAGAAYVPMDRELPKRRADAIAEKSGCRVILNESMEAEERGTVEDIEYSDKDIAYVIFTSGSSGEPKGVYVTHEAVANTIADINRKFNVTCDDTLACASSIGFDLSAYDIFGALTAGASLALMENVYDAKRMAAELSENGVTVWNSAPAIFNSLIDFLKTRESGYFEGGVSESAYLFSLRLILLSGDWIPKRLVKDAMEIFGDSEVISLGGATEASIWSIYYPIKTVKDEWRSIPYGYPLANQRIYILDEDGDLAPVGAKGQIYIGGRGVAEGYYNDRELTDAAFVEHEAFGRVYKTGDYGTFTPEGYVEFQGRKDSQVKINGFRVELGEIENVLKNMPSIKNGVVVTKSDGGDKTLHAYVISDVESADIKEALSKVLPYYMIPSVITVMDEFPLTRNGKIDRNRLKLMESAPRAAISTPETVTEKALVDMLKRVARMDVTDVNGHFTEIGGDSLAMAAAISGIRNEFGADLKFNEFLALGSVRKIAAFIDEKGDGTRAEEFIIGQADAENLYQSFPLTDIQMSYLIGRNEGLRMGGVSAHAYYEVENAFDMERLQRSLRKVIERNRMLRAVITPDGFQRILEDYEPYEIETIDLSSATETERESLLSEERRKNSHKIFALGEYPMFEFKAFKLREDIDGRCFYRLSAGFDLLIADGVSMRIFVRQLMFFYENEDAPVEASDFTFRDYIMSLSGLKQTKRYDRAKTYWESKIDAISEAPNLPMKRSPDSVRRPTFKRLSVTIDKDEWRGVKTELGAKGLTPSAFLLCAYGRTLAFYANMKRITLNLTVFTRFPFHQAVNDMIGDFTSVMLIDMEAGPGDFYKQCENVQKTVMEGLEHVEYDGVKLIREISKRRNESSRLLFPIVFTSMIFENEEGGAISDVGDLVYGVSQTSQVHLDCQVMSSGNGLTITWDYAEQLFDDAMMKSMFDAFVSCVKTREIEICEDERLALERYNDTDEPFEDITLIGAFERQAEETPDKIAVRAGGFRASYAELNRMAARTANFLSARNVKAGDRVAVYAHRDIQTVANILAVLKIGAAYVPIDPDQPKSRTGLALSDAKCEIALDSRAKDAMSAYDDDLNFMRTNAVKSADVAYIIYTSGSSGRPKGVVITHKAAMNTITDINRKFQIDDSDSILCVSSFTFDLSVYDIFGSLCVGATLILARDSGNAADMASLIAEEGVTIWNSVPALFEMYLSETQPSDDSYYQTSQTREVSLEETNGPRLALLSGDYIPLDLPSKIKERYPNCDVISLGGATEAAIWSIYYPVKHTDPSWKTIPYGYPLANQRIYTLDQFGRDCPFGTEGEIYIGGAGLALEYCGDPEKTEKSFITHPIYGRLYKTGDMGAHARENYVEFMGRRDSQVKIHGYRIELGEIESAMLACEGVESAVIVKNAKNKNALIGYYVSSTAAEKERVLDFLNSKLPKYMIPPLLKRVDKMPLTKNGKIDYKKLAESAEDKNEKIAPRNDVERALYGYFKETLNIGDLSVFDNFFELGGDSLKGIALYNKLQEEFIVDINSVFQHQTIESLAKNLTRKQTKNERQTLERFKRQLLSMTENPEAENALEQDYKAYLSVAERELNDIDTDDLNEYDNILLTGATGYLGAYLLKDLLENSESRICAIVRGDGGEKRLKDKFSHYFGSASLERFENRLEVIEGDISKDNLGMSPEAYEGLARRVNAVFNCAAKTQHIGLYKDFYENNVLGVENLLEFCLFGANKDFYQMSTTRVMDMADGASHKLFSEYDEDISSELTEFYARSKLEAEKLAIRYREKGVNATIFRIGTIVSDSKTGRFQENMESNAFYLIMRSFFEIGRMPDINSELLDLSFADYVSEAVLKLAMRKNLKNHIHHVFNYNKISMAEFYNLLKEAGMMEDLRIVDFDGFYDFAYENYKDERMKPFIETLLLHASSYIPMSETITAVASDRTKNILEKLGFRWPEVNGSHIEKMISYGTDAGFFKVEKAASRGTVDV